MKVDAVQLICGYKQVLSSIIKLGNLGLCSHTFLGRGSPSAFFLFQVIVMGNTDYLFSWLSVNF
jgi:hypothetical protein